MAFLTNFKSAFILFVTISFVYLPGMEIIAQSGRDTDTGLLFHLSADHGFTAETAGGKADPTFLNDVAIIDDGAVGKAFRNEHFTQQFAYDAPGNMYAERGTFSFFWRPRDPVGDVPFILIQAGPSDGSSLIMNFMRIDYNGKGGFDAFISDVNRGVARVSHTSESTPEQGEWVHLALAWDETRGVELYMNGNLVARKDTSMVFYSGLDQFGVGGRGITPHYVGNEGYSIRGGDFDEYRIYDRMLSADRIKRLARGRSAGDFQPLARNLDNDRWMNEWYHRYGWNRSADSPPALPGGEVSIRKVEIHDVYDVKQWWWKGNDGIRETTWPSVYNRSRISDRHKYIIQPDWNTYSVSGKEVSFFMPDEPFNHIEIAGAAFGTAKWDKYEKEPQRPNEYTLFDRPAGQERTFHRLSNPLEGGIIRFENDVQETAIGEFMVYNVEAGSKPAGRRELTYRIDSDAAPDNASLTELNEYIEGRYMPDERGTVVALPGGAPRRQKTSGRIDRLPLVHVLIPFGFRYEDYNVTGWTRHDPPSAYSYTWENMPGGLDGVELQIPALNLAPTHGDKIPINVKVMDPIWPDRALMDINFSVDPDEPQTLWLDTRDRILPNGYPLYLTVASASGEFGTDDLEGATVRLVFKEYEQAKKEHIADRFVQAKDNAAHFVEPGANSKKLRIFKRFTRDMEDLLRIDPDHSPGRQYWYWRNGEQGRPYYEHTEPPAGVPLWAHRQVQLLKQVKKFTMWWIDERQIENGEFGGGLSDDGDLTPQFVAAALMGVTPDKITDSIRRMMDAFFDQGMFTNGLSTIMADELHAYEEGIQVLPQDMQLSYGDPKAVERLMNTADAYDRITGINRAGHRHFISNFFSGTEIADETVWQWQYPYHFLILHAGITLVDYNDNPRAKKLLLEMADGLLAHRVRDEDGDWRVNTLIHYPTDQPDPEFKTGLSHAAHLLWAAWRWTGEEKYLQPIRDQEASSMGILSGNLLDLLDTRDAWGQEIAAETSPHSGSTLYRHLAWQVTENDQYLEELYADQIERNAGLMYINTEGHMWSDRVSVPSKELQRARLGGVGAWRSALYPGHVVSWEFEKPARAEDVAIAIPEADREHVLIRAFNLKGEPVRSEMTAWDMAPGDWEVTVGIDRDRDGEIDRMVDQRRVALERMKSVGITFSPQTTSLVELRRVNEASTPRERPDLGIGKEDVVADGNTLSVKIHNLGSKPTPATALVFNDRQGNEVARAPVSALEPPVDLQPRFTQVTLQIPREMEGTLHLDPENRIREITERNNTVSIRVGK